MVVQEAKHRCLALPGEQGYILESRRYQRRSTPRRRQASARIGWLAKRSVPPDRVNVLTLPHGNRQWPYGQSPATPIRDGNIPQCAVADQPGRTVSHCWNRLPSPCQPNAGTGRLPPPGPASEKSRPLRVPREPTDPVRTGTTTPPTVGTAVYRHHLRGSATPDLHDAIHPRCDVPTVPTRTA